MTAYNKFIVAIIMAFAGLLREHYGIDLGMSEEAATVIVGLFTAGLVWLVPNRRQT